MISILFIVAYILIAIVVISSAYIVFGNECESGSICYQQKIWENYNGTFPTIVKNVEWCTSSDYAICKIDGYLVDCEEQVEMCLSATKQLSDKEKQYIKNQYLDENGTRLCLGKYCREMVDQFKQEDYYNKFGGQG